MSSHNVSHTKANKGMHCRLNITLTFVCQLLISLNHHIRELPRITCDTRVTTALIACTTSTNSTTNATTHLSRHSWVLSRTPQPRLRRTAAPGHRPSCFRCSQPLHLPRP